MSCVKGYFDQIIFRLLLVADSMKMAFSFNGKLAIIAIEYLPYRILEMMLSEDLTRDFSKRHTVMLAKEIGEDQGRFDELISIMISANPLTAPRAAWVASHCSDMHPWLVQKHLKQLIENLQNPVLDAVKRNSLRMIRSIEIPENMMGLTADVCFKFLYSTKEPIAVKVYAMDVLFGIIKKFPEMKDELKIAITDQMPFGSAGFRSKGRKILKMIDKMS